MTNVVIKSIESHELANMFPMMISDQRAALTDSIKAEGLQDPIIKFEGLILDGRNRMRACVDLGIKPKFKTFSGTADEALSFVITKNLKRRHLTPAQRAKIGASLATLKPHQKKTDKGAAGAVSQKDAAKAMNVSKDSIQRAKAVKANGTDALKKAVFDDSSVTMADGAKIAKLDKPKQAKAIAKAKQKKPNAPKKKLSLVQQVEALCNKMSDAQWSEHVKWVNAQE